MNSFNVGGVTNVVKEIYRGIDKTKYKIDFVRCDTNLNDFDKEVLDNGDKIYYYKPVFLNKIPFYNYYKQRKAITKQILAQIKGEKYDVIHVHANANIGLYVGKKAKIPVRILHFHEAVPDFGDNVNKSFITKTIWKNRQKKYNRWATVKAGDSLKACKVKYGEKVVSGPKLCVLYPPIDFNKFNPKNYDKNAVIKKYGIDESAFNILHVGRLTPVKNQKFIIDVLKEISDTKKAKVYFVGDGECKNELILHAEKLGVKDAVEFLPPDTSPDIYLGMNCSLLPSFSEAFGMVAVESQLMGVRCFCSTNVPSDVDVGGCEFLDLSLDVKIWVEKILAKKEEIALDKDRVALFKIESLLKTIENLYSKI